MNENPKVLSVAETADLCKVGRSTIGYWIRSKKLVAGLVGRGYIIPIEELLHFLKKSGRSIPSELIRNVPENPSFRKSKACWEFWNETNTNTVCNNCIVFVNQTSECFTVSEGECPQKACHHCQYFLEIYYPKIQMIYQFNLPAAITKDLYFWGANEEFAKLCGVKEHLLVGLGIERVVHPDSLQLAVSLFKKSAWGNTNASKECNLFLKRGNRKKIEVRIATYSLKNSPGVSLVLMTPREIRPSIMHAHNSRCRDDRYY